jgi:hypothetical protein
MALTQDVLAGVVQSVASGTLTQLYRSVKFPLTGVTDVNTIAPQTRDILGTTQQLKRPKSIGEAQTINPRSSGATFTDPGYVFIPIEWDNLFVEGFNIYGIDQNIPQYVQDYSVSCAAAIGHSVDKYFYEKCFRNYTGIAASGTVYYKGELPVLQVVFKEDSSGNLVDFTRDHLVWANQRLNKSEVPQPNRYACISPNAAGSYLISAPTDTGENFVGAQAGGVSMLTSGFPGFLNRHGLMVAEANTITEQERVTDLGDGAATCALSSPTADTTVFLDGEMKASNVPLGAVKITLTVTAALNAGIAVGKIARLGPDAGAAKAYGIILRVSGKDVWLVPYDARGNKLVAAQIIAGTDKFSIPQINSVNTCHHSEYLAYLNAPLARPFDQSILYGVANWRGLSITTMTGNYQLETVKESAACYFMTGCKPTDHRKAVLMLSA